MKINTEQRNGALVVHFKGEIDHSVTLEAREQLDELINRGGFDYMVIDLKDISFMDSAGIGLIMGRYKKLRLEKKLLYLRNVTPSVDKILKISGLYKLVNVI